MANAYLDKGDIDSALVYMSKMGNKKNLQAKLYFYNLRLFTLKGDGTSVAAGSDGCVYSMSTGDTPLLFSFFIAMVGTSFCLGFYNSGDSTWHFRPINAAVTLNVNSRLNFSGVFIK